MNRWIGPLVALVAVGALVAPAVAQNPAKPAIVYSTGGKFDKSFNEG
jgi:basic membrane protein A